jgi:hypothetical protein
MKNILTILACIIVIISHLFVYILLPIPEHVPLQNEINTVNSFHNYFSEKVMKIPGNTSDREDDDIERTLQIIQAEAFCCRQVMPALIFHIQLSGYPPQIKSDLAFIDYDVLSPPPRL